MPNRKACRKGGRERRPWSTKESCPATSREGHASKVSMTATPNAPVAAAWANKTKASPAAEGASLQTWVVAGDSEGSDVPSASSQRTARSRHPCVATQWANVLFPLAGPPITSTTPHRSTVETARRMVGAMRSPCSFTMRTSVVGSAVPFGCLRARSWSVRQGPPTSARRE